MKRMIDLKEFLQLQQLATDNKKRLDDLENVYTYSTLAIDADDFDCIDTASPENFEPVNLAIGDHVYIDGEQTDLTAEMIADIYDSNLVVLSCGDYPANYPNVILQRQVIDPASGALSPKSARFEAFVTLDSTVYHYTMIVTKYDSTSEEGGSIVLACTEAATKAIYCHPIFMQLNRSGGQDEVIAFTALIFNNSPTPLTKETFISWFNGLLESTDNKARLMVSGTFQTLPLVSLQYNSVQPLDAFELMVANTNTTIQTKALLFVDILDDDTIFEDGVNRIN